MENELIFARFTFYFLLISIVGISIYLWILFDYFFHLRSAKRNDLVQKKEKITFQELEQLLIFDNNNSFMIDKKISILLRVPKDSLEVISCVLSFRDWLRARFSKKIRESIKQLWIDKDNFLNEEIRKMKTKMEMRGSKNEY